MAERITYGKTWWGQQWLNALTSIDMANRLPRGKTYANKGAVQGLKIDGNQISASIKGSAPRPYRSKLSVPLFSDQENELLLTEIQENPVILAQLLNRQLPGELTEFAQEKGIQLFPHTFDDLTMGCSCPDYAIPCKHLAAVVYVIANEIDRNPFLVFQLKGLDILTELQKLKVDAPGRGIEAVLSFKELCTEDIPEEDEDWKPDDTIRAGLDFATIPPLTDQLLDLLAPEVTFAKSDFHKSLSKAYRLFSKAEVKPAIAKPNEAKDVPDPSDSIEVQIDELMSLRKINIFSEHGEPRPLKDFSMNDLTGWLDTLTEADWPEMSDSVRGLYLTQQFAAVLLRRGAVVPQLLRVGPTEEQYRVRWLPATLNESVRDLASQLTSQLSPTLLTVRWQKDILALPNEQQVLMLCSLLMRRTIRQTTIELWERWPLEDADRLFFGIETLRFEGFGKREMPLAMQLWLNDFFLSHKRFVPIMMVEDNELGDEFRLSLLIRDREAPETTAPIPLAELLTDKQHAPIRMAVLQDLLVLSRHFPDLARLTQKDAPAHLFYKPQDFVKVLLDTLPRMQLLGISLLLPRSLKHWVRPQVGGRLKANVAVKNDSFMRLDDMLTFDWQIALGDEMVDIRDFQKLVNNSSGLVKIKDQYVLLDPTELTRLYKQLESPPELTGPELLRAALTEEYKGGRLGISSDVRALIKSFIDSPEQPLPATLNATLRPYQHRGYDWLVKNTALGMGSLLADDMGLGKTLQIIALLLRFKQEGRFKKQKGLIVLPTTLLTNWQKEIARFAPDLQARVYHGSNRKLPASSDAYDLLLTTYGVVRSDLDTIKKTTWAVVIIDEAQNIKNADTEQTKAVKALKSPIRIALSGTPVENRLSEFWSIMDFVNKGYLGGLSKFNEEFGKPIQQERDHQKLDQFRRVTSPFLLRRIKTDKTIISDLPDKIENNQFCALTPEQAALYQNVVQESLQAIEDKDGIARRGLVLKLMTALKQIGNHPHQYLKKGNAAPSLSGKATLLLNLLETIYANHEKVLIFTQYREMGELLQQFIQQTFGQQPLFLHGGTSRADRDEMVEQFQRNRSDHTFILSLKAGGTGLNLTQANHVIHYDLWWNPAVESQATDRAFRIGQTKNVLVYRLMNQGTLEEKIDAMIRSKRELADLSVKTGETWLGDLSDEELTELVSLG
ncbi:DEAD/DEAH box helicase [Spirosoma utsteinense]|uniref:Zn finger protein/superfamily II DNA or RNA helicase n=1 Tax=Spirosoma utsteinense TaxID=2585773 RepID=A0ABR6W3X1_9BACT|nr:DEAD/DEAH box helicase [Spirosoma utsteinense]MBC3784801.1 putative Zn finger protein/superfamily II DNA or RNA helicase [Spirosoma utsteinense]MBC3791162.1 putative Zn finger protein/superfamily II DNA or RNA helicase [Spirosoma utsteinense]